MITERIPINRGVVAMRKAWRMTPPDLVRSACLAAGFGYAHFKHCAAGRRRMSPDAAHAFPTYLHKHGHWKDVKLEQIILPRVKPTKPPAVVLPAA